MGQPVTQPRSWWAYAAIAVAVIACYAQVARFDYVNIDDAAYVTHNPNVNTGLSLTNIGWAFTSAHQANWHPLTWISHMIDVELFGIDHPGGHHLHNVLLHIINSMLLLAVLTRLTGDALRSAIVAGLFALHPTHVESVAWIAERKDVLSTMFGFAALWCWAIYVQNRRRRGAYVVMCVLFACSLMSKPMLVTLPCVMLLLDVWPLKRFGRRAVIETLPLFALAAAMSAVTLVAQSQGDAIRTAQEVEWSIRLPNVLLSYARYVEMTVLPINLVPFYPMSDQISAGVMIKCALLLLFITVIVIIERKQRPWMLIGWLWFVGMLVPVCGLIAIGTQAMADRYLYVPAIGAFIAIVWSLPKPRWIAPPILIVLGAMTFVQVGYWRDSVTLLTHARDVQPDDGGTRLMLGQALRSAGRAADAQRELERGVELLPGFPDLYHALGQARIDQGDFMGAAEAFAIAARLAPDQPGYLFNAGVALTRAKRFDLAEAAIRRAIDGGFRTPPAYLVLGNLLAQRGQLDEAIEQFERALQLAPDFAPARENLERARAMRRPPP